MRNIKKLNLIQQYFNEYSCSGSDGTVVNTMFARGDEANGQNSGMWGNILGTQIGKMTSLKEILIYGNSFSGTIASEIGSLKQLGAWLFSPTKSSVLR